MCVFSTRTVTKSGLSQTYTDDEMEAVGSELSIRFPRIARILSKATSKREGGGGGKMGTRGRERETGHVCDASTSQVKEEIFKCATRRRRGGRPSGGNSCKGSSPTSTLINRKRASLNNKGHLA